MTVSKYPTGTSLAEALTDLYSNITSGWVGIPLESISNEVLSGNPTATFSRIMELTFQSGASIESVGLVNFVSDFVDAVASGETLASPFEDLNRQLPSVGYYNQWAMEYMSEETFPALVGVDTVLIYGASNMRNLSENGQFLNIMNQHFSETYGLNITTVNKGIGGETLADILSRWEGEKATYTGQSNVLILLHPLGNTVSGTRPWTSLTAPAQQDIIDDYTSLLTSMRDNGNIVIPMNTTFRDYDGVGVTVNNEAEGSDPYNDNVVSATVPSVLSDMMYQGRPYHDTYNLRRNYYSHILADAVHANDEGDHLDRRIAIDNIARRILGQTPNTIPRVEDPTLDQTLTAQPLSLSVGSTLNQLSRTLWSFYEVAPSTLLTDEQMYSSGSYDATSVTLTRPVATAGDNAGALNTSDTSISLTNDNIKDNYLYTDSSTFVTLLHLKGFAPNQSVTVDLAGYKDAADFNRVGEYTLDGGSTIVTLDSSTQNTGSHIITLNGNADSSGELLLEYRLESGATFAYFNGAVITPN